MKQQNKKLYQLLEGIKNYTLKGDKETIVEAIEFDSRLVRENSLFVAINGTKVDGHSFIEEAILAGAKVIVCKEFPQILQNSITYIRVANTAKIMGLIASNFYGNPSKYIQLIAVTGTNGKTTVATLLYRLFKKLNYQVGLISTVENRINDKIFATKCTTPDILLINKLLAEMQRQGCMYCFIEVSSHALVQERTSGIYFSGAIFTNISHDHLDYHHNFKSYIYAKKLLFDNLPDTAFALVNADDKRANVMLQNCKAKSYTYALRSFADFKARLLENTFQGLLLNINSQDVWFRLIGKFNAYNLLAIYATASLLGENADEVLKLLSYIDPVKGRFELINGKVNIIGLIDYAHTPDALKKVLETIQQMKKPNQYIITVFGCGGERDIYKRPLMGKIAAELSDKIIITSDNPRNEKPEDIISSIQEGIKKEQLIKVLSITSRGKAIEIACQLAHSNDIILIAGKGHEEYQEIKGKRKYFNDKQILKQFLEKKESM